jgi:hypothetical protein
MQEKGNNQPRNEIHWSEKLLRGLGHNPAAAVLTIWAIADGVTSVVFVINTNPDSAALYASRAIIKQTFATSLLGAQYLYSRRH